ncbi:hypothetical protein CU097_002691 [Rhizopus azygosporus]|uniref:Uncharacterized protein n=1 Tax=Rhizopus azygosporus TaxID=86630 RepID=A0A367JCV3_RHIAZ|nr:hypothetical protein CU097_002691 [Rhizopus azygosporus]
MNLTNNYDLSIGTDLISKLGIGFDCKRSYDDFSELLTEADRELSDYENVLQVLLVNIKKSWMRSNQ